MSGTDHVIPPPPPSPSLSKEREQNIITPTASSHIFEDSACEQAISEKSTAEAALANSVTRIHIGQDLTESDSACEPPIGQQQQISTTTISDSACESPIGQQISAITTSDSACEQPIGPDETAVETNSANGTNNGMSNILPFCGLLGRLKHLPRAGWLRFQKIRDVEPVAGHMYRMAVLAFCLDDFKKSATFAPPGGENPGGSSSSTTSPAAEGGNPEKNRSSSSIDHVINQDKCIKLALVHDMAESIVGDITPFCGISREEKSRREFAAMKDIASILPPKLGQEMYDLYREYEAQQTPESRIVKELDRFDLMVQAYEYEKQMGQPMALQEFFESSSRTIQTEPVLGWFRELMETREKEARAAAAVTSSAASSSSRDQTSRDQSRDQLRPLRGQCAVDDVHSAATAAAAAAVKENQGQS